MASENLDRTEKQIGRRRIRHPRKLKDSNTEDKELPDWTGENEIGLND